VRGAALLPGPSERAVVLPERVRLLRAAGRLLSLEALLLLDLVTDGVDQTLDPAERIARRRAGRPHGVALLATGEADKHVRGAQPARPAPLAPPPARRPSASAARRTSCALRWAPDSASGTSSPGRVVFNHCWSARILSSGPNSRRKLLARARWMISSGVIAGTAMFRARSSSASPMISTASPSVRALAPPMLTRWLSG